jgi:hypothetical protein
LMFNRIWISDILDIHVHIFSIPTWQSRVPELVTRRTAEWQDRNDLASR